MWEAAWEAAHPPPETTIDLGLDGPTILGLRLDPETGLLTVVREDEVIAQDISVSQIFRTISVRKS